MMNFKNIFFLLEGLNYKLKRYLLCIFLLSFCNNLCGQIYYYQTIPTSRPDVLSQNYYKSINTTQLNNGITNSAILAFSKALKEKIYKEQLDDLKIIDSKLERLLSSLARFVKYDRHGCYQYIKGKYKVINVLNMSQGVNFRNGIIQQRYYSKLNNYYKEIANYANKRNPIPQGERLLLTLNSLENAIKTVINDEKF